MFNPTPDCNNSIENNPACEPTCDWPRNVDCGDRPLPGASTTQAPEQPTTTQQPDEPSSSTTTQGPPQDDTTTRRPPQEGM